MLLVQVSVLILMVIIASRSKKRGFISRNDLVSVSILLLLNFATLFYTPNADAYYNFNTNVRYNDADAVLITYIEDDMDESFILEDIQAISNIKEFKDKSLILDKGVVLVDDFGNVDNSKSYIERYSIPVKSLEKFNFHNLKKYKNLSDEDIFNKILDSGDYNKIYANQYINMYKKDMLFKK